MKTLPGGNGERESPPLIKRGGVPAIPERVIPMHNLDHEHVVKFALGESVTAALEASGKHHLLITASADATTPEHLQGRRIMHAVVITQDQANDLHRLMVGTHHLVKIKPAKPAKP